MTPHYTAVFRLALNSFPAQFRHRFAAEMESVFEQRCEERTPLVRPWFLAEEMLAALVAGTRLRIAATSSHATLKTSLMIAMLFTTLTIHGTRPQERIDFNGHDPAGAFTITVVGGKAIAATLNRITVARSQIIQKGDSISILGESGEVALAVQFDSKGAIRWTARE